MTTPTSTTRKVAAVVPLPPDVAAADSPIDGYFELSYTSHLVINRTLLQSMPDAWQRPFVALLRQFDEAFDGITQPEAYAVVAGRPRQIGDLDADERALLGITYESDAEGIEHVYWYNGTEHDASDTIVWPEPDPIPPYNRGRATVPTADTWTCPNGRIWVSDTGRLGC